VFIIYPEAFSTMSGLHLFYIYYRSRPGVYNLPSSKKQELLILHWHLGSPLFFGLCYSSFLFSLLCLSVCLSTDYIYFIYITGPGLVFIIYPEAFSTMPGLRLFYIYYRSSPGVYNLPKSLQYGIVLKASG
jgi:hypothetical protein